MRYIRRETRSVNTSGRRYKNVKIDLNGMGWEDVEWINLTLYRFQWHAVVNMFRNIRLP
jgi:hypothetical protein